LVAPAFAQDVTVTNPVWMRSTPAPDVLPQPRHRLRPDYPADARQSGEIGYVIISREVDANGKSLSLRAEGNEVIFQRAVEAELIDWEMKPALQNGLPVDAAVWQSAIFNPPSAAKNRPDATPRLLRVAPVRVPGKLLRPFGDHPVVDGTLAIDAQGAVSQLTVDPAVGEPLAAAMRAEVANWRFAPARQNGQPIAAPVSLPIVLSGRLSAPAAAGKITPPVALKRPRSDYPMGMLWSHLRGDVTVDFIVDPKGAVQNASVKLSNNPDFEDAALDAVRHWTFKPGTRDGTPAAMPMEVSVIFDITGGRSTDAYDVQAGNQAKLPPEFQYDTPPRIRGAALPIYPYDLRRDGVEGKAKVAFVIDPHGRVIQVQVLSASRPEFGLALTAAVETFRSDPALKQGKPTQTALAQEQDFSRSTVTVADLANHDQYGSSAQDDFYLADRIRRHPEKLVSARTLDHPLHPIGIRAPVFPSSQYGVTKKGSALVEVVVDENGRARIPRIISASDPAFGYAAVQAVANWRFDPPLVGGKTVTTHAEVPFDFVTK
jgi:TonB family protein